MKKHKELIILIITASLFACLILYLSFLITFDLVDFFESESASTSKQKIYYLVVFWLNSVAPFLVYLLAVVQTLLAVKLLHFSYKGILLLLEKINSDK